MKIAIIGGIGSGKTTLSKLLKDLGKKVYNCDEIYQEILLEKEYIDIIDKNFLGVVQNGVIDKKILGNIVFKNKDELLKLNAIAHPRVREKLNEIAENEKDDIYVEVPVFIGSGLENFFDRIILVTADIKIRIQRIIARNNCDKEYAKKIINSQPLDLELEKYANIIILNNKDIVYLRQQLIKVL